MVVAIYSRKSIYSDKSDSTQVQYNIGVEYAKSHCEDYEIYRYEDEGYTGANADRPAFSRLIKDVKEGNLDVVICYKIDRISRNVSDFSNFFNLLTENNVEFVSIKEQIDTSTPLGRAMMYICSVFAQMERETIAERVKDGMINLSKTGKWTGGRAPLGYARERITVDGKSHTVLVEDPDNGLPLLNYISDTFLNGNYSLNRLENFFRDKNVTTMNGNYLSATQIYNILRNPTYCCADARAYDYFSSLGCEMSSDREKFDGTHGILVYGRTKGGKKKKHTSNPPEDWIVSVGLHKPLWTSEKYIKIQSRFGQNKFDKTRKHKIGLLKGVLKCSCGWSMRVQHKVDKTYNKIYNNYFCQQRNRKGAAFCDREFTPVEVLDNAVIDILKQIKLDKSLIDSYVAKEKSVSLACRSMGDVQQDINRIKNKILNLTNNLGSATGSTAAKYIIAEIEKLDLKLSSLNYELLEIKSEKRKQNKRQQDKELKYELVCEIVNSIEESADYDEINGLIKELFKECIYDGKNLQIKI